MLNTRTREIIAHVAVILAIFAWVIMPAKKIDTLAPRRITIPDVSSCSRDHCCCDRRVRFARALLDDDCCEHMRYVIPLDAQDTIQCAHRPCPDYR